MAGNDKFYTKPKSESEQFSGSYPQSSGQQVQTGEKFGIRLTLVVHVGLCCFEAFSVC